ncbi:hypothetical protein CXB49_11860 [Chromobacterium sp. ATCC 53434]|uniref:hypothetical protein n=1 Tax=Chromobacterium TaxID=535 RepID=UPI000C789829|nr:hypothetical protein [Chromobacterium sp. ATCC 53434]AUH51464.1 hypothetical protein CXB49_11860 [Chromobacterium sp. ATCC 53434]
MPALDMPALPAADPLTIPYRSAAPRDYAQARDILVKAGLRAADIAKNRLNHPAGDKSLAQRRSNFIVNQGRLQAALGFVKLALLADGGPRAPVSLYWKIGERVVFQAKASPSADVCDGVRRIWMSAIWQDIWDKGVSKQQIDLANLPGAMFQSGKALFDNPAAGSARYSAQASATLASGGEILINGRPAQPFRSFSLDATLSRTCLNGAMTYTGAGAALPLYQAPYPGLFQP